MNFIKQVRLEKPLVCMCSNAVCSSNDVIDRFFFLKGNGSVCVSEYRRSDHFAGILSVMLSLTKQSLISGEVLSIHNSAEISFLDKVLTTRA